MHLNKTTTASPGPQHQHAQTSHVPPQDPLSVPAPSLHGSRHRDIDVTTFSNVEIAAEPILRPPPSAFTCDSVTTSTAYDPHASPLPLDQNHSESPRFAHSRSLTGTFLNNCQPLINRATTTLQQHTSRASFHSPTKSLASFIPSRSAIESTASQPKIRALQNWFNGASGQVNLGIGPRSHDDSEDEDPYDSEDDYDEDGNENMMGGIFNRGASSTRSSNETEKQSQSPAPSRSSQETSSAASNRFAWLLSTQKNAAVPAPMPSPTYHNPSDELLNLNISQALFPHGPVDPLAPSSFNDLLSSAESLISRYQTSYRQLSTALVDARAEQSAQEDELDEADTRIRHLKMQMETMAARAADQDEQMRRLMEDLMFEKRARQEDEEARKRSLALVRDHNNTTTTTTQQPQNPSSPTRRRTRISNSDVSVDSGFESECETDAASIFSTSHSKRECLSPTGTEASSIAPQSPLDDRDTTPKKAPPPPPSQGLQRKSTYERTRDDPSFNKTSWGCANCEGGSQASVWGRLAREREENSCLRRRVGELEEAVDSALCVVDGPWGV
ncbi:hypothetical protein DM02DRAFT_512303 [Periconia macrospinosa]|uniref:Uncharacterized protein n=1 Tax=Periconia macrospinosa TaxID=97972 RepID=A0A2V1EAD1_9PLEO|nr:hypothetical protein DM02DRAFT_512303 [Periconia macrospinosa]